MTDLHADRPAARRVSRFARVGAAALLVIAGAATVVGARSGGPGDDAAKAAKKQMMDMLAMKGQPTEAHKRLEDMIGTFDVEISFSMGPQAPAIVLHAKQTGRWILGKRFVQVTTAPAPGEEAPMESLSIYGFDARSQDYFWFGIDSTDTYSVFAQGKFDEASKAFTLHGTNEEPGVGKVPFKHVLHPPEGDRSVSEIWFQMKGVPGADAEGWFKVATFKRTRTGR